MARLAFPFSYQSFTRYVRDRCDSQQEIAGSQANEAWLYGIMCEYLTARHRAYDFHVNTFLPAEFQTGRRGAPRRVDFVGYSAKRPSPTAALLIEAKLMIDDNRQWAQEVVTDILRIASVRENTNRKTQRYVMVVGQERCWEVAGRQMGGALDQMLPMTMRRNPLTLWMR